MGETSIGTSYNKGGVEANSSYGYVFKKDYRAHMYELGLGYDWDWVNLKAMFEGENSAGSDWSEDSYTTDLSAIFQFPVYDPCRVSFFVGSGLRHMRSIEIEQGGGISEKSIIDRVGVGGMIGIGSKPKARWAGSRVKVGLYDELLYYPVIGEHGAFYENFLRLKWRVPIVNWLLLSGRAVYKAKFYEGKEEWRHRFEFASSANFVVYDGVEVYFGMTSRLDEIGRYSISPTCGFSVDALDGWNINFDLSIGLLSDDGMYY